MAADYNPLLQLPPAVQWDGLFPAASGTGAAALTDDPRARTLYVQQYSLSLQRQLPGNLTLEAAYVGSVGRKLNGRIDINQGPLPAFPSEPLAVCRPYPAYAAISMSKNSDISNYNALQLKVEKTFSDNLYFLGSYTYSKSLDTASASQDAPQNRLNKAAEYGLSSFDQRQRLALSWLYHLPFGHGQKYLASKNGVANAVLGGWRVNGIVTMASGTPFSVGVAQDRSLTGVNYQRANVVGPNNGNLPASDRTVQRWFNTAAFVLAPTGTFGNAGRNILYGPGTNNIDFSLFKDVRVVEGKTLQLRAEMFNALNHAQFLLPIADPTSLAFGQITAARAAREIQFGVKFIF